MDDPIADYALIPEMGQSKKSDRDRLFWREAVNLAGIVATAGCDMNAINRTLAGLPAARACSYTRESPRAVFVPWRLAHGQPR